MSFKYLTQHFIDLIVSLFVEKAFSLKNELCSRIFSEIPAIDSLNNFATDPGAVIHSVASFFCSQESQEERVQKEHYSHA